FEHFLYLRQLFSKTGEAIGVDPGLSSAEVTGAKNQSCCHSCEPCDPCEPHESSFAWRDLNVVEDVDPTKQDYSSSFFRADANRIRPSELHVILLVDERASCFRGVAARMHRAGRITPKECWAKHAHFGGMVGPSQVNFRLLSMGLDDTCK